MRKADVDFQLQQNSVFLLSSLSSLYFYQNDNGYTVYWQIIYKMVELLYEYIYPKIIPVFSLACVW